ncbi:MAG: hypothetical protein AB2540_09270 [Candidatus Thiodiazotropha endolucinida]
MPDLVNSALRLLKRLLGTPSRTQGPYAGNSTLLDGNTAVSVLEAGISEGAGLGASYPALTADLAWRSELKRQRLNFLGSPVSMQSTEGARGVLAASIGMSMSGVRATGFLSGPDLACSSDLLTIAAGRRLPLVIHLTARSLAGHAPALGSGHEAFHMAADSGCFQLIAANVQEAVDFSLIVRRVAEQSLIPGLVGMDGEQTALALQDVSLPPPGLVERYLGRPDDLIASPTAAQQLLLGESRRRVTRWHNPDRPVMLGGLQAPEVWGQAKASGRVFFDDALSDCLDDAFDVFSEQTGRRHRSLSAYRVDDAKLILVAQGAAIEVLEALADYLRASDRLKVGVLGVRCLRPFPAKEIARYLAGGASVCVLERMDVPLATDPPLMREVRGAFDHAAENHRFGLEAHPGYPSISEKQRPRFLSTIYGLGGLPLRGSDLASLCRNLDRIKQQQVYLGINFSQTSSDYPKRQVLLDRLRRSYPGLESMGLYDDAVSPDLRPEGALTLALHRLSGAAGEGLMVETAAFLHRIFDGGVRSRPALFSKSWSGVCSDRISFCSDELRDPGDDTPVDLSILVSTTGIQRLMPHHGLAKGGTLLVQSTLPDESVWTQLPRAARSHIRESGIRLFRVAPTEESDSLPNEYLLGAVAAVLIKTERMTTTPRRLLSLREELLGESVADVETYMQHFEEGMNQVREISLKRLPLVPARSISDVDDEVPALVRRLGSLDDAYDSLPRFWDQVGVLYKQGKSGELAPDPYLAVGAVPPLSAGFRDLSRFRKQLPQFNPLLCTGCGDCWCACPDSAIKVVSISPTRLMDAAIRYSGTEALRPVASKLAAGITSLCRQQETRYSTLEEMLVISYDGIKEKLPFPQDRKQAIALGIEQLRSDMGSLQIAITNPMFNEPETENRGSGELLALAVEPDGCKGCGICIQACGEQALQLTPQGTQSLSRARRIQKAWHGLPDSELNTVLRLGEDPQVGVAAAAYMAHSAGLAMAGGDGVEPGCGAKLALRLALSIIEAQQTPRFESFLQQVETIREKITGLIRSLLADALPADDLDALSRGLEKSGARQADMTSLIGEAEDAITNQVDAARLRRLVDLARDLIDLAWRLSSGRQDMGRARVSIVLSPGSVVGWAGSFPHNPFSTPVTLDATGDGAQLAAGLLEGQLRQATEGFVLMRKARAELEQSADAARLWSDLEAMTWRDLDDEERALCPTLLLVGNSGQQAGHGLGQLVRILGDELPIKTVLLADLDLGLAERTGLESPLTSVDDVAIDLALLSLVQREAFIAQTSISDRGHFAECIQSALTHKGPALVHLHAPSPSRHGFAPDQTLYRAQTAVMSRLFPLFRYDPQAEGVFGSRISLDGNPALTEPWENDAGVGVYTPVDWALGETRFSGYFSPLNRDEEAVRLAEYLDLSAGEREDKSVYVELSRQGDEVQRFSIDRHLLEITEKRQRTWRMLQELAGLVTPFTARVREEAEAAVAEDHEEALQMQADKYEQRINDLTNQLQQETRKAMHERLMRLAGYRESAQ